MSWATIPAPLIFVVTLGTAVSIPLAGCIGLDLPNESIRPYGIPIFSDVVIRYNYRTETSDGSERAESGRFLLDWNNQWTLPDERGNFTDWWVVRVENFANRGTGDIHYALVEPQTGCLRGSGNEGSVVLEGLDGGLWETRSRYTAYYLGDSNRFIEEMGKAGRREAALYYLGSAIASGFEPFDIGIPMFRSEELGTSVVLTFRPQKQDDGGLSHQWTMNLKFDATNQLVDEIRWTHQMNGTNGYYKVSTGALWVEAAGAPLARIVPNCQNPSLTYTPRTITETIHSAGMPPDVPIPKEYPMREAYEDAMNHPKMRAFMEKHGSGRFIGMHVTNYNIETGDHLSRKTLRLTSWEVAFARPDSVDAVEVEVQRTTDMNAGTSSGTNGPAVEYRLVRESTRTPLWTKHPIVPLSSVLELAKDGDMPAPNRIGWMEPPYNGRADPIWEVSYYDPWYGRQENATRTTFWFDAETGWLTFSAFNTEIRVPHVR